jgi:outer membrane lipoprotein-sorting protein
MSVFTSRQALRWAVPGAVVAIVLGAAVVTSVTANAPSTLPARTAAELLVDVQNASVAGLSGTVVQDAALGLPELPVQIGGQGSSSFTSLVSGTHTLRVWYAGADQQRIALQGTLGESDVVRNGSDVWTWASDTNTATHYQLPAGTSGHEVPEASAGALTPQQAADAALAAIDPTTTVTTDGTDTVAGRAVYELVLSPRDTTSLIGQVRIAIDAEQHVPLRVQVFARKAPTPAFEVGFSSISFDVPPAQQFHFSPPPDSTVTESSPLDLAAGGPSKQQLARPQMGSAPRIVGTGWTSVLVAELPSAGSSSTSTGQGTAGPEANGNSSDGNGPDGTGSESTGPAASADLSPILSSLPEVSGTWGSGRLLQSTLFSVLLTDDGRLIAGAVAPEVLYKAASK